MNVLVDTHALLWWLADDPVLSEPARTAIADESNRVFVSAASAWEISIKTKLGKLRVGKDIEEAFRANDLEELAISIAHAKAAGSLPLHHRDPFDRMLIAQAIAEDAAIVTGDPRFAEYGVRTIPT